MQKGNTKTTNVARRRFIVTAAATAAVISMPAKATWSNGISSSIIASGHGSDWAGGNPIRLQGISYWQHNVGQFGDLKFNQVFGDKAFEGEAENPYPNVKNGRFEMIDGSVTFLQIMTLEDKKHKFKPEYAGPNGYNRLLVAMVLNALTSLQQGHSPYGAIFYPVINGDGRGKPFVDAYDFAHHLYDTTSRQPGGSASELIRFISNPAAYHAFGA